MCVCVCGYVCKLRDFFMQICYSNVILAKDESVAQRRAGAELVATLAKLCSKCIRACISEYS